MRTSDFDFSLPEELIAQRPAEHRNASRLMVLHRESRRIEIKQFTDLAEYLHPGDHLVLNNSKVIPARLFAINPLTQGRFELLLLEEVTGTGSWWAMMRPAKRARPGTRLILLTHQNLPSDIELEVKDQNPDGHRLVHFHTHKPVLEILDLHGILPLPPYIERPASPSSVEDKERYQTVFASPPGSVAAPTAGLHFTSEFLHQLESRGISKSFVTLHVGAGTFAPVKAEELSDHVMHEERYEVPEETAAGITRTRAAGGKVVAVGTTSLRVLESAAMNKEWPLQQLNGRTRLFVYPPYEFKIVDALLTNFHLPKSTLLMLVSAFAGPGTTRGRDFVMEAYRRAIEERFRFFSYGDAMLIV